MRRDVPNRRCCGMHDRPLEVLATRIFKLCLAEFQLGNFKREDAVQRQSFPHQASSCNWGCKKAAAAALALAPFCTSHNNGGCFRFWAPVAGRKVCYLRYSVETHLWKWARRARCAPPPGPETGPPRSPAEPWAGRLETATPRTEPGTPTRSGPTRVGSGPRSHSSGSGTDRARARGTPSISSAMKRNGTSVEISLDDME